MQLLLGYILVAGLACLSCSISYDGRCECAVELGLHLVGYSRQRVWSLFNDDEPIAELARTLLKFKRQ